MSAREWDNWESEQNSVLKIDRYGDNLNILSIMSSLYSSLVRLSSSDLIEGNPFVAWDQQRIVLRLIHLEGNYFDIGDDIVVRFNLEIPVMKAHTIGVNGVIMPSYSIFTIIRRRSAQSGTER